MRLMDWDEIERASTAWRKSKRGSGPEWDEFRGKFLPFPSWYEADLDPKTEAYLIQQDKLWGEMSGIGENYEAEVHELTQATHIDPVVRPGLYSVPFSRAGDHLIALGHIVKHSGAKASSRILEYGAGFGQIALTFARMGAEVHTVDVDPVYCSSVAKQAAFFNVKLTPHREVFGYNPGGKFNLVIFYESFHHCREFLSLVSKLSTIVVPGGKVMMAGEPIYTSIPWSLGRSYPWGIRLTAKNAAVVRMRKWYELGFQRDFLVSLFAESGFSYKFIRGQITNYADIHEFIYEG